MQSMQVVNTKTRHGGVYIKKAYNVGRAMPLTGIRDCCGNVLSMSFYCESKEARTAVKQTFAASKRSQEGLQAYLDKKLREPKADRGALRGTSGRTEETVSAGDIAMENAAKTDSNVNAPMLSSWLYKNVHEEPTVLSGMMFLQQHLDGAEGCELMLKHDILGVIQKVHNFYRTTRRCNASRPF